MNRIVCLAGFVVLYALGSPAQAIGGGGVVVGPGFFAAGYRPTLYVPPPCVTVSAPSYVVTRTVVAPPVVVAPPPVVTHSYVAPAPALTTTTIPAYGVVGQRSAFVGPLGGAVSVSRWYGPHGTVGVVRGVGPFGDRGIVIVP